MLIYVDLPIINGDFPELKIVCLPEDNHSHGCSKRFFGYMIAKPRTWGGHVRVQPFVTPESI
jgi:hypothetical protein